ncbi:DUF397 domain-containing protein [Nocardiopsis sp. CNT312]|uniref:DUF397 domain-containing protein n=1 Tax=Nocardiopsis sp. CNT312 TaxID=1137268 RepID=UPI0004BABFEF|nr:DUF397 domain-containing protein [Nocardiopsis sp. CNT312]
MNTTPGNGYSPAPHGWHVSSHSNEAGTCVEVAQGPVTGVRDSQHPDHGALFFPADAWTGFITGVSM